MEVDWCGLRIVSRFMQRQIQIETQIQTKYKHKYKVALGSGLVRSEDCELVYEMESSTLGRGVGCWGSFGIEALFMERAHILRGGAETIIS